MEPGTKQIDAGELAGLRGVRGSHGGSCSLSMCAWDGYHLGISACGKPLIGTKAHQDVSEKLNPRCSSQAMFPSSSFIL